MFPSLGMLLSSGVPGVFSARFILLGGGRGYSDDKLLLLVIEELIFCIFFFGGFMDSFFYSQGSYIYFHIYSLYQVSVIFGHSDMFICLILHIFVHVLVPFFLKLNVVSSFGRGNIIRYFLEWFRGE